MKKVYLFLVVLVLLGFGLSAQNNGGAIKITLTDKKNKESIPFANVVVYNKKVQVAVGTTNMDGEVMIKPLVPGKYNVKAIYVGYQPQQVNDVEVLNDKTAYINLGLTNENGVDLQVIDIVEYKNPLIDPDTKSGGVVDRESFQHQAAKDLNSVISTQAGVILTDNGTSTSLQIRGSRPGNTNVFVDGERSIGTNNLPQSAVEEMSVVLGGLPAQYGDVTGGVVSITTRGIQPKLFGGVEAISSEATDPYGYNFLGFSLGGPIISKKDSTDFKKPIIGFFLGGEGIYQKDPRPWANGITLLNSSKLSQLEQNPIQYNQANSTYYTAASFISPSDLYTSKVRPNVASKSIRLAPKIDFAINPNLTITLGGSWDYNQHRDFVQEFSMFDSQNNPLTIEDTKRGYLRLTQKFGAQTSTEQDKTQSVIKRAYFNFQASYQAYKNTFEDATFKNNYFDYGYVGKFNETHVPIYKYDTTLKVGGTTYHDVYALNGYTDQQVAFTPGTQNPLLANYTSSVINSIGADNLNSFTQIYQSQGLVNGSTPNNVQSLYYNTGTPYGAYSVTDNRMFRVTSNFSADIKNHALMIGVEYDLARQLANQHNQAVDTSASSPYVYHAPGTYTVSQFQGAVNSAGAPITSDNTHAVIEYNSYNLAQMSTFAKNFYDQEMGIHNNNNPDPNQNYSKYIDVDNYDPSHFSLSQFSPDELLNSGVQVVSAYGYDYTGKRLTSKVGFDDFLNKFHTDKFGDKIYDRLSGGFTPVYMAGYIQDKFDFKDIKFNVGLRVDRYDANQMVLKDPFLLKDAFNTGDLGSLGGQYTGSVPSSIPKDAVIYVQDNNASVKQITGFRSGSTWYDASGNIVSDPKVIAETSGGQAQPWLKNPTDKSAYSNSAFTAYKPQINVMPRVAFSFPISDVANFFAHYDILTQRPQGSSSAAGAPIAAYNRTNPQDYFFISQNQGGIANNGNLKPERTVDYELGFSQLLNEKKSASLKLSAFYREMRNQVQITKVNQAYPLSYLTYGNIDFGTVKGFSAEFQMRRTGGFSLSANYTLQFADGSGSNANGGYNLANSSQPNLRVILPLDYDQRHTFTANLDYRFGEGKDYRGPQYTSKKGGDKEKNHQILKNIGINVVGRLNSGLPYSQRTPAASDEEVGNNITQYLAGSLNGARLPWQFKVDMRIDKNFNLFWGSPDKGDKRKQTNLNVYVQVLNLFNTKNVIAVHNYTGSPTDDGYLSSAFGINEINQKYAQGANYGQGFTTLYNAKLNNGSYYTAPRMIRIGLQFDF